MKNSNWTSQLETGVSELDLDNRSLLDLVNRVKEASDETNLADLKSALLDFQAEMIAHFEREERLMTECNYDAAADHRREHQQLAKEIREQIESLDACQERVASIGRFMHNWIVQHIADKDSLFGKAIISQTGTTDRRQDSAEEFDIFEERRMGHLEAIRWTSEIAVGIESIDSDHRSMIALLNQIVAARRSSDRAYLATLLEQFGNETTRHFKSEEALITRFDTEHATRHMDEHRNLMDEYAQQVDDWRENRISAELLCRFMYRWILRHISESDIPLGEAIYRKNPDGFLSLASPPDSTA